MSPRFLSAILLCALLALPTGPSIASSPSPTPTTPGGSGWLTNLGTTLRNGIRGTWKGMMAPPAMEVIHRPGGLVQEIPNLRMSARYFLPGTFWKTLKSNYAARRAIAMDLTVHDKAPTLRQNMGAALQRSMKPTDMRANVKSAWVRRVGPVGWPGILTDPIGMALARQLAEGRFDLGELIGALHPAVMGGTFVGGTIGEISGATLQSLLAGMGPVGASAGFFLRPAMAFAGSIFGYNVGQGMVEGQGLKGSLAKAFRDIEPFRDGGQLIGAVVGATLSQILIPIPIVGGLIGSMVFGALGGIVGRFLGEHGPLAALNSGIKGILGRIADRLDGGASPESQEAQEAQEEAGGDRDDPGESADELVAHLSNETAGMVDEEEDLLDTDDIASSTRRLDDLR